MSNKQTNPKMTRDERLEKKRMAERVRYQRIKNNATKFAEQQEKERRKYQNKKMRGTVKLVKDMTPLERKHIRKQWKERSKKYRSKHVAPKDATNAIDNNNTPLAGDIEGLSASEPSNARAAAARRKSQLMRKLRNKKIKKMQDQMRDLKKKLEKYKKRLVRAKEKREPVSPKTQVAKLLKNGSKDTIEKTLLFGHVIKQQIEENVKKATSKKENDVMARVLTGRHVQKYKLLEDSGFTRKRLVTAAKCQNILNFTRKSRKDKISAHLKSKVLQFLEEDTNSRICSGKKEFVVRSQQRNQKRYLKDSLRNLHKKFISNTRFRLSYSSFCKCRPFWIVTPKVTDRDTCLCVVHSNIDNILEVLNRARIITNTNCYQKMLISICCDRFNEQCLARTCLHCKERGLKYHEFDNSTTLKLKQWVCVSEEITDPKTKKSRKVTKYAKKLFELSPRDIVLKLEEKLVDFLIHEMNIVHQYKTIREFKNSMTEKDCLIHMDFSENYSTKCASEIQAFHFGGSRAQISLHTVVVYTKDNQCKDLKHTCYCSMTRNLSHSPGAIWAHLMPILQELPHQVVNLHFLSDGPVTQYRNKNMFYFLANKLKTFYPKLINFSWNYHEAGHGKGAPDGVGAVCKRMADKCVALGTDVTSLENFASLIRSNCPGIKPIVIEDEKINDMELILNTNSSKFLPFKGTLKVHQVKGSIYQQNKIYMKTLSCFCSQSSCNHFLLGHLLFKGEKYIPVKVEEVYADSEMETSASGCSSGREQ